MFIEIYGKSIYYEVYGAENKDVLVYLHGGPGASCMDFVNQAKALGGKLKVVIFDQMGVLRSDAIAEDEDYSMEYQVEMLEEMRRKLGIERWRDNFLPLIQKLPAPLLLINGRYDPACTEYQTGFVLDQAPNAVRVVFENSGHFPRIEEADKYTCAVLKFMENNEAV